MASHWDGAFFGAELHPAACLPVILRLPRLLELFSGTGPIGNIFRSRGWEVISIDSDPKMRPTLVVDIGSFEYRMLGGSFDAVWCSPPCTQYSIARSNAKKERDLDGSDQLVRRCRDIIPYVQPMAWFIENPHSGLLKGRDVVSYLPSVIVDYCMYGWPYRKRTIIFTNCTGQRWTVLCHHDCGGIGRESPCQLGTEGGENPGRWVYERRTLRDAAVAQ